MPDEQQLSQVLSEFARTILTDFPIQAILDQLVERIVDVMPVTAAGVTIISPGLRPHYVAASSQSALRFELLQTELNEGPCVLAYRSGAAVTVTDLRSEDRFPNFTPRALSAGMVAVFTFPLRHGDVQLGALDLYRDECGPLSDDAMRTAQTLADVAAAYLLNAQSREDLQDSSERSREAALHDALTGLPNRVLMLERLEHAFLRSRRSGKTSAVIFIDLDQFKRVNDTHGHRAGDELLMAVGRRVSALLRPEDTLARLSGDEFVILCEDLHTSAEANAIGARISTAFDRQFRLTSVTVNISASVGIAFADSRDQDPDRLLHTADMAMYQAKRRGGDRMQVLDLVEQRLTDRQTGLEDELREASRRDELFVEYQPIVTAVDGRITGVEALIRWDPPNRGLVPPATLIPLAEQSGLISQIGQWILGRAWADHCTQSLRHGGDLTMSVNISAHQLMSPGFTDIVAAAVSTPGSDSHHLTLELTESVFVRDGERALVVLNDLKDLGVRLALDDFGTGYSSLSFLNRFPIDVVKIDEAFVAGLGRNESSDTIVGAIIQLVHNLGMLVVAEGVETARQHDALIALNCDSCQGYYFARPMTAVSLDALIRARPDGTVLGLPVVAV